MVHSREKQLYSLWVEDSKIADNIEHCPDIVGVLSAGEQSEIKRKVLLNPSKYGFDQSQYGDLMVHCATIKMKHNGK